MNNGTMRCIVFGLILGIILGVFGISITSGLWWIIMIPISLIYPIIDGYISGNLK